MFAYQCRYVRRGNQDMRKNLILAGLILVGALLGPSLNAQEPGELSSPLASDLRELRILLGRCAASGSDTNGTAGLVLDRPGFSLRVSGWSTGTFFVTEVIGEGLTDYIDHDTNGLDMIALGVNSGHQRQPVSIKGNEDFWLERYESVVQFIVVNSGDLECVSDLSPFPWG